MSETPILEEIRQVRENLLAEHGGDLRKFLEAIRDQTEQARLAGKRVVAMQPKPPRQPVAVRQG